MTTTPTLYTFCNIVPDGEPYPPRPRPGLVDRIAAAVSMANERMTAKGISYAKAFAEVESENPALFGAGR